MNQKDKEQLKPRLSKEEYEVLKELFDKCYNYIARDKDGALYVYRGKPSKEQSEWNGIGAGICHHFQFVKWEDDEPTSIKVLLAEYENAMQVETTDDVNHPSHYKVHKHECIDEMIAVFGVDETMAFCKLNAWKYRYRAGAKDGEAKEKDLAKADWYLDKYMELKRKVNDYENWNEID